MKSTEVYKVLREEIGPWAKQQRFKRGPNLLSWYRPAGNRVVMFWFQVSFDYKDAFTGSKFTFEIQNAPTNVVGDLDGSTLRMGFLLDAAELEEVRTIQNQIISRLPLPPDDYFMMEDPRMRRLYLKDFEPVTTPYAHGDDIWFRYRTPEDVCMWAKFILKHLPRCVKQMGT